jgi:hypothetical protein
MVRASARGIFFFFQPGYVENFLIFFFNTAWILKFIRRLVDIRKSFESLREVVASNAEKGTFCPQLRVSMFNVHKSSRRDD